MATLQSGNNAVKRAAANPLLELLERLGYVVRGALYAIVSDSLDDFFQARVAGLHVEAVVPVADLHQKQEIEQFLR